MSKTPQEAIGAGKDGEQHAPIGSISAKENRRILDEISSQESSIAEVRGEIGGAWKQYERLGGHKDVGKLLRKLSNMTALKRQDFLRAFDNGVADLFESDTKDMFEDHDATVVKGDFPAHQAAE